MKPMVEVVADAIEKARADRAYGLYDYSSYPGTDAPHVVRYESRAVKGCEIGEVGRFADGATARALYEKLSREYVAQAAIRAMTEWMAADVAKSWAKFNRFPF